MQETMRLKTSKFRIRYLILAAIVLAVAAGVGMGLFLWLRGDDGSIRVVTGVQFPYPDGWAEEPLSEADRKAGLLLKLERQDPGASFLARTVIAQLAPEFDIVKLADETEAALTSEIENFDLLSREVVLIGPFSAVRIEYRQTAEDGVAHQVLMAIVPTRNQTYYLTLRAERGGFRLAEEDGLRIINDFVTYVSSLD